MKNIFLILIIITLIATANNASADFDKIYTVGAYGNFIEKKTFDITKDKPWLYLRLPESDLYSVDSFWKDPDDADFFKDSYPNTTQDMWLSLDGGQDSGGNPIDWSDVKKLGLWKINANYLYANGNVGKGSTEFEVTPEPISSILFLAGGATLIVRRYRKQKKT